MMPGPDFTAICPCPVCGASSRWCPEFDLTSCPECGVLSSSEARDVARDEREAKLEAEAVDLLSRGVESRLVVEIVSALDQFRAGEPVGITRLDGALCRAAARAALILRNRA